MRRLLTLLAVALGVLAYPAAAGAHPAAMTIATLSTANYDHIVLVMFENHSRSAVVPQAPFFTSFAQGNAQDTAYQAVTHPSLPNYLAVTGGSTFGVTNDSGGGAWSINAQSIWGQTAGYELAESMPSNCGTSDTTLYSKHHAPYIWYAPLKASCPTHDLPLNDSSPQVGQGRFTFITPNKCNDAHDCSISVADSWFKTEEPRIEHNLSGRWAIVVTFDEGSGTNQNVYLAVKTSGGSKSQITTRANHYDLLAAIEAQLGVARLGPGDASKLAPLFGGSGGCTSNCPPPPPPPPPGDLLSGVSADAQGSAEEIHFTLSQSAKVVFSGAGKTVYSRYSTGQHVRRLFGLAPGSYTETLTASTSSETDTATVSFHR